MTQTAVIIASGLLQTSFAKTTHGLVRGPSRYRILGVVDPGTAGRDAGEVLDGVKRDIPIFETLTALIESVGERPDLCLVGVATVGGVLPAEVRAVLREAADLGMSLVNGLHQLLSDDPDLVRISHQRGGRLIDLRRPKPVSELRFWSGDILELTSLRVAVLGTDCALGKRTTASLLRQACRRRGLRAEMIYTGQTGWLQGVRHGFMLDATPNDFVCGELEAAILECQRESDPEVIFLEGQSGLRNPSGPCGSELILGAGSPGVVLQHAPGRRYYEGLEEACCEIPPLAEEIAIIRLLGSEVWAVALNDEGLDHKETRRVQSHLADELSVLVVHPLWDGVEPVVDQIEHRLRVRKDAS